MGSYRAAGTIRDNCDAREKQTPVLASIHRRSGTLSGLLFLEQAWGLAPEPRWQAAEERVGWEEGNDWASVFGRSLGRAWRNSFGMKTDESNSWSLEKT